MQFFCKFWPDLATCHCAGKTLEKLTENGISYVPKDQNPPNCPQIRPIENLFGYFQGGTMYRSGKQVSQDQFGRRKGLFGQCRPTVWHIP